MKLRVWEIAHHLTTVLEQNPTVFRGNPLVIQMWLIGKKSAILQRGEGIALSYGGCMSAYFSPDLCKVSADSIAAAIDCFDKAAADQAGLRRAIADTVSVMTYRQL
jgi:hypothetical protein